jgi:PAS domain S-box-containing protein
MTGTTTLQAYLNADILAIQTTPMISRSGALLGMVSTHWREPHELKPTEADVLDILARLAADLIERSQVEEKLRESENRFQNMADTAPLMIWMADPNMRCTFVNKAWLEFTGRTLELELGDGWTTSIHPEDFDCVRSICTAARGTGNAVQTECRKRRADGEYRWVLASGVPRFGQDGRLLGYVGTSIDITDLKQRRDEDAASQKLESVGRLAGGIAHDFNNILGAVLAQADLALAGLSVGGHPIEELNRIRELAIRGGGIVRQLMIYAGQESRIFEPVSLSCLIEDMRDLLKVVASKHAVLRIELGRDTPLVQANPAQLRQVVMNLVTNASEAIGGHDGVIMIRTARSETAPDVPGGELANWVELEISDTGCGIKRDDQAKIFDPFFSTKPGGHGLGLAVVQTIVKGLGGAIQVESEGGRGSTFRILLPCLSRTVPAVRPTEAEPTREELRDPATVLVVEDEDSLRLPTAKVLRMKGFNVYEAGTGTEALAAINAHKETIAVVLLDMTLPGAPSREVLAEARRLQPNVKVIVTSAYGPNKLDELFHGIEIDSFLRKPYTLSEVVSDVLSLISTGSPLR